MKPILLSLLLAPLLASKSDAHEWKADGDPGGREALRQHILDEWLMKQQLKEKRDVRPVQLVSSAAWTGMAATLAASEKAPAQSVPFQVFPKLELKWDDDFLYVGSNGLPAHNMMVGITAWQQQVPLPQSYFGDNAWRIPLHPVPAKTPAKIEGNFLRGAIALAVNGVPIFNPQNNRGEVSYEIGELDEWGGHCGRGDDYHYHIAPLHLQALVGEGKPIAYALDGYPIYGLTEPDGSPLKPLDECHGHDDPEIGYHYHASTKRPYLQSAFYGEVTEAGGQVDPQPRAQGVRPDSPPLRGAVITAFETLGENSYQLSYEIGGEKRSVSYRINDDGTFPFEYDNGRDGITEEVYTRRGGRVPGGKGDGKGKGGKGGSKGKSKGSDQGGLIKPSLDDTMRLNVYADNWFMLYVNGRLVAVDPIPFTPHNVVSVDLLPEYPMTIAILAKDNANPETGMEYGTSIGDGGLILKFGDGTVTNATWKAKRFFHGPIDADIANPQVKHEPLPENWWTIAFDDSAWEKAKEYSVEEVNPKQAYYDSDFEGAKFIWSADLALDNTVVFRTRIEKPDWTPRWNTKPDLDTTGAPLR